MCAFLTAENDQTEAENLTETARGMTKTNQGRESNENNGTLEKPHDMTGRGREIEKEKEENVTRQKREKGTEQGKRRSLRTAIGGVEVEIGHLTGGRAGSRDTRRIIRLRWALLNMVTLIVKSGFHMIANARKNCSLTLSQMVVRSCASISPQGSRAIGKEMYLSSFKLSRQRDLPNMNYYGVAVLMTRSQNIGFHDRKTRRSLFPDLMIAELFAICDRLESYGNQA